MQKREGRPGELRDAPADASSNRGPQGLSASPMVKIRGQGTDEGVRFDMCLSCGCGQPNERHGNDASITADDLQRAAEAAGIEMEQAADNIHDGARQLRDAGLGT